MRWARSTGSSRSACRWKAPSFEERPGSTGPLADSLARVAARAHARSVRVAVVLVLLPVFVETVERAAAGAHDAADRRALARALATVGDRAAGRTNRRADDPADRRVLHDLPRLVLLADLIRRLLVARVDDGLRRNRRRRGPRRRLLRSNLGGARRRRWRRDDFRLAAAPLRDDETG